MFSFFFFNDTATTEIYTLSLHDALPISLEDGARIAFFDFDLAQRFCLLIGARDHGVAGPEHQEARSEEHTSELQSQSNLVCRLLLEKKNKSKEETNTAVSGKHAT